MAAAGETGSVLTWQTHKEVQNWVELLLYISDLVDKIAAAGRGRKRGTRRKEKGTTGPHLLKQDGRNVVAQWINPKQEWINMLDRGPGMSI